MRIILVGDTNIQDRETPVSAFSRVKTLIDRGDICFAHAEGMFTESARDRRTASLPYKERWRHSTPEMMKGFREAGFDGLSMASNVSADTKAVVETLNTSKQYGMLICGIGKDLKNARKPIVVDRKGVSISFFSRTSVFWPHLIPAGVDTPGAATVRAYTAYQPERRCLEMPGAAPSIITWPDKQELAELADDIASAKRTTDIVILSMHWGVSGKADVCEYQRMIARTAIDAGADIVFGHHPHVVSSIEVYRHKPIFYSLGNFAFDWEKARNRILDGIVLEATWEEKARSMTTFRITPVRRDHDNLVAELVSGAEPAIYTRDFLINTAMTKDDAILRTEDNDVLLMIHD